MRAIKDTPPKIAPKLTKAIPVDIVLSCPDIPPVTAQTEQLRNKRVAISTAKPMTIVKMVFMEWTALFMSC